MIEGIESISPSLPAMHTNRQRQTGITLIEVLASLAVIAAMTVGVTRLIDSYTRDTQLAVTAQHLSAVGSAAQAYIKDNYAAVQAVATPTTPALVTVPMLIATGYLTTGYSTTNNKGQSTCVLVLEPTANMLNALVITEGGTTIDDISLGGLAGLLGANGGGVYSTATTTLRGTMGGWSVAVGNYASANASNQKCDGTAGTPAIAAGHPIMALWFANGDVSSGFLHRNAVPGHPELNTMNTPLIMSSIQIEGAACTTTGAVARDATGLLLSCQAALWQKQGGGAYWKDPVANVASLPACDAASAWQTRVVQAPTVGVGPRAYTCNGATWQPLSIDDSGNLLVAGRMTAANETITGTSTINALNGNLQVTATAAEGAACVGEGRIASSTTSSGLILSCQSGVWAKAGGRGQLALVGWLPQSCTPYCPLTASSNVSWVLRNGVGDFTIQFATALPSATYLYFGNSNAFGAAYIYNPWTISQTAGALRIRITAYVNVPYDPASYSVIVF